MLGYRIEYDIKSINGSTLIPLDQLTNELEIKRIKQLSIAKQIYIHCKSGKRSKKAIILLKEFGINATNVDGGMDAWLKENY